MKFKDLPIGCVFICKQGKCRKVSNIGGKTVMNAIGYHSNTYKCIHGLTDCVVIKE